MNLARVNNYCVHDKICTLAISHQENMLEKCVEYWILYNFESIEEYQECLEYEDLLDAETQKRYHTTTSTEAFNWTD